MKRHRAFTLVEILVVIAIILVIVAILLPTFAKVRDRARYTRWAALSNNLRTDTTLALYYNMENQDGDEVNKKGFPMLQNKAVGDPMALSRGASNEDGHGQLGNDTDPNTRPEWDFENGRFPGKGALAFEGAPRQRVALNKTYGFAELPAATVGVWVWSNNQIAEQVLFSFDRSDNFRLALKDDAGANVGWDTAARQTNTCCINDLNTDQDYADGSWHLIMGWYKPNAVGNNKRIYVDAENVKSVTAHDNKPIGQGGTDPSPGSDGKRKRTYGYLGVGSEAWSFGGEPGPTLWLDAYMDEAMLFERALTEEEITNIYKVGRPRDER